LDLGGLETTFLANLPKKRSAGLQDFLHNISYMEKVKKCWLGYINLKSFWFKQYTLLLSSLLIGL